MMITVLFVSLFLLALLFGVINGFINGGGLMSSVITTRALEPFTAVMLVAVGEIVGMFIFGQAVAHTLGGRMVLFPSAAPVSSMLQVIVAALLGALIWNTSMWRMALPSSSGHALVGGIVGAFLAGFGRKSIIWPVFIKIFLYLGLVPLLAGLFSVLMARVTYRWGAYLTPAAARPLRWLQILGLGGIALAQGSNDGQKSLAMIVLACVAVGTRVDLSKALPAWSVTLLCGSALALGVIFGSRRVFGTLGRGLYRIQALQGFCAEMSTMMLISFSSVLGYPMSTTQVISTSVLGAGLAVHPRDIRWNVARDIGVAWLVTIPAAALFAAATTVLLKEIIHVVP